MTATDKNFYCSQKFWWLSVDLSKRRSFSCCSASAEKIDVDWLKDNPGQLFNTPHLQKERMMMLENKPVPSCSATCWQPESRGLVSRREQYNTIQVTHTNIKSDVEILNIFVDTQCNMTCVYCCKQYSSAWLRDIIDNGSYTMTADDRYTVNNVDLLVNAIGQKQIRESSTSNFLLEEVGKINDRRLQKIDISGGEPFLYNGLIDLVKNLSSNCPVYIFSGLGVDEKRFSRVLKELCQHRNIKIAISADVVGPMYEFIRYGNTWSRLEDNLAAIRLLEIEYEFYSILSNLTLFGIRDLFKYAGDSKVSYNLCSSPDFLSMSVLDPVSKKTIAQEIDSYPHECRDIIMESIKIDPSTKQRRDLALYLFEFSKRRNISLDIFPAHFVNWIKEGLDVV